MGHPLSASPVARRVADATPLVAGVEPPPERPAQLITLPEPMLGYACNQQGCCCGGWRVALRAHDLVRLRRALPPREADRAVRDVEVVEEISPGGSTAREFSLMDEGDRCRFLAPDARTCGVHARAGVSALPDICADFPVVAYEAAGGPEFFFDPVCPSVLDALATSDGPVRAATVRTEDRDAAFARRSAHLRDFPAIRIGVRLLSPVEFSGVRDRVVASLSADGYPAIDHLRAIDAGYSELGLGERSPADFRLPHGGGGAAYRRFFRDCVAAHGTGLLAGMFEEYRRFLFAIPLDRRVPWGELDRHLRDWEDATCRWLEPSHGALQGLMRRWLAHRHFAPFLAIRGRLYFAASAVVHIFATGLRYAAAFGAVLRRPVDRDILKAALGTAEYFYRALEIAPDSLPWLGLSS